ncbi:NAD(P) transhydrogenase subunit alpha [Acidobacteria bacterium Mor1]|nr:NAD(P) transhydrogenase subunit alpha [Acidobacteria bacterium Mor1]
MIVGITKETYPGERRVAMTPAAAAPLIKKNHQVLLESGAGTASGYLDEAYKEKGVELCSRADVFAKSDVVLQVRGLGANPEAGKPDLDSMRKDQILIGTFEPLTAFDEAKAVAGKGARQFALELVPRITRAQSMDVLSSMATIAGYKAVLMAAERLPRMFPMLMTAAGTITPAKAFVLGVGVAGLQAISTAKRLGAVVSANDIRPAVKEQVQSVGAKFVEVEMDAGAEDKGGYAKEMTEDFLRKQRELISNVIAESDVVITTAAIPGKKAPILVPEDAVKRMQPGSIIVDLAAERGGNCELTKSGEAVDVNGVTILGPENIPSSIPYHASQMFAKNVVTFLNNMLDKEGNLNLDMEDEIIRDTLICENGDVVHSRIREAMGLAPAAAQS